jgi:hypothetical protein
LGDAINAGFGYLEVKCLGCSTDQTVALDIVRRPKATPVHELERYMRCKDCSQVGGYAYKRKLVETWVMVNERFLQSNPPDVVGRLDPTHQASLDWLIDYFGKAPAFKDNALKIVRDKTAFHYDRLNHAELDAWARRARPAPAYQTEPATHSAEALAGRFPISGTPQGHARRRRILTV